MRADTNIDACEGHRHIEVGAGQPDMAFAVDDLGKREPSRPPTPELDGDRPGAQQQPAPKDLCVVLVEDC